jgi:hypothetical protein
MQEGGDGQAAISLPVMAALDAIMDAADEAAAMAATHALGALLENMQAEAVGDEAKARVRAETVSVSRLLSEAMTGALAIAPAAPGGAVRVELISEPVMQALTSALEASRTDPAAAAVAGQALNTLLGTMEAQAVGEEAKARVRAETSAVSGMLARALGGERVAVATADVKCDGCRAPIAPPYARCIECKDFDLCMTCADRADIDWTLPTSGGGGFHRATHAMKAVHDRDGMAAEVEEVRAGMAAALTATAAVAAPFDPNAPVPLVNCVGFAGPPGLR